MVKYQYGLKDAMSQTISMCKAKNWDTTEEHVYSVLVNFDSDLESMFCRSCYKIYYFSSRTVDMAHIAYQIYGPETHIDYFDVSYIVPW
jgi:hypothetical protein